jgi:hypothetical protein
MSCSFASLSSGFEAASRHGDPEYCAFGARQFSNGRRGRTEEHSAKVPMALPAMGSAWTSRSRGARIRYSTRIGQSRSAHRARHAVVDRPRPRRQLGHSCHVVQWVRITPMK